VQLHASNIKTKNEILGCVGVSLVVLVIIALHKNLERSEGGICREIERRQLMLHFRKIFNAQRASC
jgi:hypothetical protein